MKKVWIINQFANLPSGSAGTRHFSLAKNLKELYWDASIIAGSIEHNTGNQRLGISEKAKIKIIDDIKFFFIKLRTHKLSSLKGRTFNMIYFFVKLLFSSPHKFLGKPNLIIGSSPNPLAALGSYILSKKYNVPFIYEVRDLWPQTLVEMNVISKNSFLRIILDYLDSFLARKSYKIIVLMKGAKYFYKAKGISEQKVAWISNGVDYKDKIFFNKDYKEKSFTLTYMGSMGPANSVETILYAMNYVNKIKKNKLNIKLKLFGSGSRKKELISLAETFNLKNIYFENPIPKFNVHKVLSSSDSLILAMNNLPSLYKYGISFNKIFDYLLSGRPILIASCAKYDIIKTSNSGLISNAGDYRMLGENITKMINLSEVKRLEYGDNGRKYVLKNFLYKNLANNLADLLKELD